jgi:hypothetical protein
METPILHEAGPAGVREPIPAAVGRLDALLNLRVSHATADAVDGELRRKSALKRFLLELPSDDLEPAARIALAHLTQVR